jgi:hypothetical protein
VAKPDRKAMKEKLLKRTKQGGNKQGRSGVFKDDIEGVKLWRPKEGDHIIDIIPYCAGENDPITDEGDPTYNLEYYRHPNVGPTEEQSILCLADTFGEACPICEHRKVLQKEGADKETYVPLYPKQSNIYNIVCYDTDKDLGVQVWDVAWFYMEKHLVKLAKGPIQRGGKRGKSSNIDPNVAFADPDEGKSICFDVEKGGKDSFPSYSGHQFDDRDYEIDDETLESAQCLDELIKIPTYAEVYELYWGEKFEEGGEPPEEKQDSKPSRNRSRGKTSEKKDSESKGRRRGKKSEPETEQPNEESEKTEGERIEDEPIGGECPIGGKFGEENGEFDECNDCKVWNDCVNAPADDPEPEPEEKKTTKRSRTSRKTDSKKSSDEGKTPSRRRRR